jgi:heme-degrading monooxygenase HmoA
MVAVIFEVYPKLDSKQEYLDIAVELKPLLSEIDGFISVERYVSLQDENKILSLSFWKNEESILQWRNLEIHRKGQAKGVSHIFSDYRIRVGGIIRDYGMDNRNEAPIDSDTRHKK